MQRIRTLFLALALCLSMTPVTLAAGMPFNDVPASAWYYQDVERAVEGGMVNGKTPTKFCPDDSMTYAEAIKLAACMHQKYHTGSVTLTNGAPNWYDSYLAYAEENGIPYIFEDYNAPACRSAYVHIFYAALPSSEYTPRNTVPDNQLPDVYANNYFAGEIYTFYRAGILTGNDSWGTFYPDSDIKRSEVAAILSRMTDPSTRKTFTLEETPLKELTGVWHMVDYTVEGETYNAATMETSATLTVRANHLVDFIQQEPDGFTLDFKEITMKLLDIPLYDGCPNEDWCVVLDTRSDRCELAATIVGNNLILIEMYPEYYILCTFARS